MWANGIDWEKLAQLRDSAALQYGPAVLQAARTTADRLQLRKSGRLRLQQEVDQTAAEQDADAQEVVSYLATLGMLLLICTKTPTE